jgi:hypothetical protein
VAYNGAKIPQLMDFHRFGSPCNPHIEDFQNTFSMAIANSAPREPF